MCGIAGWFGPPNPVRLQAMVDALGHRGPDGAGTWSGQNASIGATRLSIIDPTAGAMPIWNEDHTLAVVLNGEVYNARTLRDSLMPRHSFATSTDTEVILHLFEERGTACFALLDGIFAIAITDGTRLWLARDGLGVKPLLWSCTGQAEVVFASELKSLLRHSGVSRKLDLVALAEQRVLTWSHRLPTLLEGVLALSPGTFMEVCPTPMGKPSICVSQFYSLPVTDPLASPDTATIRDELVRSVTSQLVSDVPWGVLLSGGVDSSLLTLIIRTAHPSVDFPVFTLHDRMDLPDLINARQLAKVWRLTQHQCIGVTSNDVLNNLPRQIWALERNAVSPMWHLCRHVPRNCKVLLCGEGADELFAGYGVYNRIGDEHRQVQDRLAALAATHPELAEEVATSVADLFDGHDRTSFYRHYLGVQLQRRHLHEVDMGSMAHGFEVRVPYLAMGLVNKVAPLGTRCQAETGRTKLLLREVYQLALRDAGLDPERYRPIWGSTVKAPLPGSIGVAIGAVRQGLSASLADTSVWHDHPLRPFVAEPVDLVMLDLFRACFIDCGGVFPTPKEWDWLINEQYPILEVMRPVLTASEGLASEAQSPSQRVGGNYD